jgi:hypothetical protein
MLSTGILMHHAQRTGAKPRTSTMGELSLQLPQPLTKGVEHCLVPTISLFRIFYRVFHLRGTAEKKRECVRVFARAGNYVSAACATKTRL